MFKKIFLSTFLLKIIYFFLLFLFFAKTSVLASTYYVDATGGSNINTGTATDQAWQTISKINSSSFSAGDIISFKKGETWREQLSVPSSGATGNPIIFNSYGTGNAPKIFGSTGVTTWDQSNVSPQTGNLFDEGFEATGYDNAGWSETVGSGSTVDEDSTAVARPADGGNQCLLLQKVSPNYNSRTDYDLATERATTYTRLAVRYDAEGLSDGNEIRIATAYDNNGIADANRVWELRLFQSSNQLKYRVYVFNAGSLTQQNQDSLGRAASTWSKHEIKYNYADNTFEWRVDGGSLSTVSLSGTRKTGVRYITLGDATTSLTYTVYADRLAVDSTKYLNDTVTLPSGTWKAVSSASSDAVWFVANDSTVTWGKNETVITNVNAEYDWYFDSSGFLVVYAASSPDTRYASVESPTRANCVTANSKDYITVQNLECAYANDQGISPATQTGWTIDGLTIHHIGSKNESMAEGVNIRGASITVQNSTIHDIGNHGITLAADNGNTVSGAVIQNNTFYDNYHSDVDIQAPNGTFTSAIIRYNLMYNTSSFDQTYGSGGIYVLGTYGNAINGVQIYYNIIRNKNETAIVIRDLVASPVIYNNTIYGTLLGNTNYAAGIGLSSLGTYDPFGIIIKNNIAMDTYGPAFYTESAAYITALDNNLWYQSAGGANIYTQIAAAAYHFDDFTTYKSASGFDTNGLWQDPLFINMGTNDLHLQSSSPAINVGANVSLTSDYSGTSVPQGLAPEMGAYEYIPLTVTINQAGGQNDPSNSSTINFTVVFSESVSDFITGDVTLSGTAGATTATVTGSGTTYNIAVTGMTGSGTVIASIAVNKATGATGNINEASTSTDNTITYDITSPTLTSITISDTSGYTSDSTPVIDIVSSGSPSHVAFSCNSGTNWSSWIVYTDSISSFNITNGATGCTISDGSKTISAKLKDSLGNESSTTSDTTAYDITSPSTPGTPLPTPASPTDSTTQTWTWTAATDATSGIANYIWRVVTSLGVAVIDGTSATTSIITNLTEGIYNFFVKAVDNIGNQGSESQGTLTVESTPTPTSTPTATPTTTPSSSSTSTSTETIRTPICESDSPGIKAPWLYGAIAEDSNSILLYFTPADNPVSKYVLEYGIKSGEYIYGVQDLDVNSREQMTFRVSSLAVNTTYYFKVRGGNGCATGSWSNEISAKTKPLIFFDQLNIISSNLKAVPKEEIIKEEKTVFPNTEVKPPEEEKSDEIGYEVKVKVIDINKNPVEGATVTLHSNPQTAKTNKDGIAEFKNVEKGDHKVFIAYNNFEGEQSVNLTGDVEKFELNITVKQKAISLSPLAYGIIGIMGLIIFVLITALIKKR